MVQVIKKDKRLEPYDFNKIRNAVLKSASRSGKAPTEEFWGSLQDKVEKAIPPKSKITVEYMHKLVQDALYTLDIELYREYKGYRDYKIRFNKLFQDMLQRTMGIIHNGDKENANKDSSLISTTKELVGGIVSETIALEYELPKEVADAHKKGSLYCHDLRDYIFGSINCCLFDASKLLKDGFNNNGVEQNEPKHIYTAFSVLGNVIINASSQQFGGYTIPEIDTVLAPYVEKQYNEYLTEANKWDIKDKEKYATERTLADLKQGYESIEYMLNTTNNALGQTPFVTFTFGLDTTSWGRAVTKAILEVRIGGLGKAKVPAIFPKLVFLHRKEVNGDKGSPNYDLKQLAIKCNTEMIYPDWLSLDHGYLADMYEQYGLVVSNMGCRAFLSPWYKRGGMHPADKEDTPIFTGRANCGAISIILPYIALESKGNLGRFYDLLEHNLELARQAHLYKYNKLKKKRASSNPLFFCEGGCHMTLEPNDTIEEAIKTFTWSFGYIGLDEVTRYFRGKGIHEDNSLAIEILTFISNKLQEFKEEDGLLYALYGTPAEGLCGKALDKTRETFGVVRDVTDRRYFTNSYHSNVGVGESAFNKMGVEYPMFHISTGGRIVYVELPRTNNYEAIEDYVNYAMDKGLYFGTNFQLDTCKDCGMVGEFETCPSCHSTRVRRVNRVCGYLGIYEDDGETRYNQGKIAEVEERKDNK